MLSALLYKLCLASDPQEECSQQESGQDELAQRSVDLDELDDLDDFELDIVAQKGKDEVEGKAPPSHYVTPSRSLSRLSKLEANRVSSSMSALVFRPLWLCASSGSASLEVCTGRAITS